MSCFLDTDAAPNAESPPSFDPKLLRVGFDGEWTTEKDSKGLNFRVSKTKGDTLSLVFTGTYIYVAVRINSSKGMNALFGIDEVGRQGGGVLCATLSQPSSSVVLYGASSLPSGRHTLFVTNQRGQLSLSGFQVAPSSASTTSTATSLASTPSPTLTSSLPATTSSSSSGSASIPTETSLPFTSPAVPTSPLPTVSSESPPLTPSQSPSDPAATTLTANSGPPSIKVSTYTTVNVLGGTTTTLVIESTVGVQQHRSSHGPPQGTIPGAVMGGVVLLSLLLGLGLWWRRRGGGRVPLTKGTSDPDPEPEMATRSISIARGRRSGILAISSSNHISPSDARNRFYHDRGAADGDTQVLPSASEIPTFPCRPEPEPEASDVRQPRRNAGRLPDCHNHYRLEAGFRARESPHGTLTPILRAREHHRTTPCYGTSEGAQRLRLAEPRESAPADGRGRRRRMPGWGAIRG